MLVQAVPARSTEPSLRGRLGGLALVAVLLLGAGVVSGCEAGGDSKAGGRASASAELTDEVTITDAWVKVADSGMTAVFGTIVNGTDKKVQIASASSEMANRVDIVEVASGSALRPKKGGFSVPSRGTHVMKPGGDRLMLIELKNPVPLGGRVSVLLTFADHSTLLFGAEAKDDPAGDETYTPEKSSS